MREDKYTVYDLETLSNCFTGVFKDLKTGKIKEFVIHESRNDLRALTKFLHAIQFYQYWLIGFNCNAFDAQILEFILRKQFDWEVYHPEIIANEIYDEAQRLINLPEGERFLHMIPEWEFHIPHIDIFRQKHYDGAGKRCSLKWLEFTMRFPNIESMPIHHGDYIEEDQIPAILKYNRNDVEATARLFEINKFETDLRFNLSDKYQLNLINASEPRLARDIFGKFLTEKMGIPYRDLKGMRSYRSWIVAKELIFPYIKFKNPLLQGARKFFEDLEFNPSLSAQNNMNLDKVERHFKYHNVPEVIIGLGGVHGCVSPGVYTSKPGWVIRDIDGTSFYPNLGIQNRIYPQHLSETFCDVYEDIFKLRQTIDKKDPINYALKIVLNSTYGLSREPNNYLHDPNYTFAITINGQLQILMLAEILKMKVKSVMFYQLNTDGITIGYDPVETEAVEWCMKKWTEMSRINLEDKFYDKMVIRDVNNYIAVDTKGKVKRKGIFGYSLDPADAEMQYHKNPSMLIVAKALEAYFVHGKPIKDYILESQDIYDFCIGVKIKHDFQLKRVYYDKDEQLIKEEKINEKVVRFYVSLENATLQKEYKKESKMGEKDVQLVKGYNCTYFNVYQEKPMKDYNINYAFYMKRAQEIINVIQPHSTNLKLF